MQTFYYTQIVYGENVHWIQDKPLAFAFKDVQQFEFPASELLIFAGIWARQAGEEVNVLCGGMLYIFRPVS